MPNKAMKRDKIYSDVPRVNYGYSVDIPRSLKSASAAQPVCPYVNEKHARAVSSSGVAAGRVFSSHTGTFPVWSYPYIQLWYCDVQLLHHDTVMVFMECYTYVMWCAVVEVLYRNWVVLVVVSNYVLVVIGFAVTDGIYILYRVSSSSTEFLLVYV